MDTTRKTQEPVVIGTLVGAEATPVVRGELVETPIPQIQTHKRVTKAEKIKLLQSTISAFSDNIIRQLQAKNRHFPSLALRKKKCKHDFAIWLKNNKNLACILSMKFSNCTLLRFPRLERLSYLSIITITNCVFSLEEFARTSRLHSLEQLYISGSGITSLKGVQAFPKLYIFSIENAPHLNNIQDLFWARSVRRITIAACSKLSHENLEVLQRMNTLHSITLRSLPITKFTYKDEFLTVLQIINCPTVVLPNLSGLQRLKCLRLQWPEGFTSPVAIYGFHTIHPQLTDLALIKNSSLLLGGTDFICSSVNFHTRNKEVMERKIEEMYSKSVKKSKLHVKKT